MSMKETSTILFLGQMLKLMLMRSLKAILTNEAEKVKVEGTASRFLLQNLLSFRPAT
jgi:hypothetical protein